MPSLRNQNGGKNQKLSEVQENVLKEWMDRVIMLGFTPRLDLIWNQANLLLSTNTAATFAKIQLSFLGKNWLANFVKRNPKYSM